MISATERHAKDPRHSLIYNARKKARKNDLKFNLLAKDIVIPERCPVLGIKLKVNSTGSAKCCSFSPTLFLRWDEVEYNRDNVSVISLRASRVIAGCNAAALIERLESGRMRGNRADVERAILWLSPRFSAPYKRKSI